MRITLFFLIVLIDSTFISSGQEHNIPLANPANIELLKKSESMAKDYVAKNLNRFAYERMQKYDYYLDSLYKKEKKDSLAAIDKSYRENSRNKRTSIDNLTKEITELSSQKEKLDSRYWALVRKAVLSFALWITIVLVLLQVRKTRLKKSNSKFESTNLQLVSLEESAKNNKKLNEIFTKLKEPMHKLSSDYVKLNEAVIESGTKLNNAEGWNEIVSKSNQLNKNINLEDNILNAVLLQSQPSNDEKVSSDINSLCEQYVEIAYRGIQATEEFNCQVTKDFEKKIPAIKINQTTVGSLLLNVLTNAFQSVRDQNKKGIKGYQPKVSISTRILPRFLQIRIKDNGTGINGDNLKKVTDEFYSTRPLSEGSGLGLYIANNLITEHKGEIKIESEEGISTDIYIKFFI